MTAKCMRAGVLGPSEAIRRREPWRCGPGNLLNFVAVHVARLGCLHSDRHTPHEQVLDSACQFDVYATAAVWSFAAGDKDWLYWSAFWQFDEHRSEPAARRLISDDSVREQFFPESDDVLAAFLSTLDQQGAKEGFAWFGFSDPVVASFLADEAGGKGRSRSRSPVRALEGKPVLLLQGVSELDTEPGRRWATPGADFKMKHLIKVTQTAT